MTKLPKEKAIAIIKLRDLGLTTREIRRKLNICESTVWNHLKLKRERFK